MNNLNAAFNLWQTDCHTENDILFINGIEATEVQLAEVQTELERITLEQVKLAKIKEIEKLHDELVDLGVTFKGSLFQCNTAALSEVLTAKSAGWVIPTDFVWVDYDNVPHPATFLYLKGLANAMAVHKSDSFTRKFKAKTLVNASTSIGEVEKVVF